MDSSAEAESYDRMDHGAVNQRFVADLLAAGWEGGDVLDLGTGTARIPIEICQRVEEVRIMATDLSISMLELARLNIEISSMTERVQLDHCDAKDLPYASDMFDAVVSNSIVHHIPDPRPVLQEAQRVVRYDGLLFFRDLMRPSSIGDLDALVAAYTAGESDHARQLFRDSLHAALTLQEIRGMVATLGYPPDTVSATSDRHWTWVARQKN